MKITLYFLAILFFALSSCSTKNKSVSETGEQYNAKNPFENYLTTLEQIPLPFKYNPLGKLPELSKNYDKQAFEKYNYFGSYKPLGILFNDAKTVAIIDFSIGDNGLVPFLTTYDKKGNKIDSLAPFQKSGGDIGYFAIEYLTINKDKTVVVLDSITTYKLKSDNSDVDESTKKITTSLTKYTIEENGHIKNKH
ncbi:MAG: hypothetical protein EBS86_09545 [Crocinitomicaceae bacterium]|nr:hypothetical protein [Crocinitomicaceae bacterium]